MWELQVLRALDLPSIDDMEDAGEDETIKNKDGETGHNAIDAHLIEKYQLIDIGTCAEELE